MLPLVALLHEQSKTFVWTLLPKSCSPARNSCVTESNVIESVCRAYCLLLPQVFSLWMLLCHGFHINSMKVVTASKSLVNVLF
jgi:hypothetical protein